MSHKPYKNYKDIPNRITKEGKEYELLSGPWENSELEIMFQHLWTLRQGEIGYVLEKINGLIWVYRDACGYLNTRDFKGTLKQPSSRFCKKFGKPQTSEYRKLLQEIQNGRLATA